MNRKVFQDPSAPYPDVERWTLQIHAPLPDPVPIGHFETSGIEVVDEVISREEYLERIRRISHARGENFRLRFYAYYGQDLFDASILDQLPEIRSLAIDTYCPVSNGEAVGRLRDLTDLSFSPRGKNRPDMLAVFGVERLISFTMAETGSPAIDLAPLGEADSLVTLRLLARGKNTEAIGNCTSLTELTIRPSEHFSLGFINRLHHLEVLKFVLGKTASISAIGPIPRLRDLSFKEVHLLEELGDLQRFTRLRRLQLSDQKRIGHITLGAENCDLEHIELYSVPELQELRGFSELPALKSLWAYDSRLSPCWVDLPLTLTHFQLVSKRVSGRDAHDAEVRAHGLIPDRHPDARFFYK